MRDNLELEADLAINGGTPVRETFLPYGRQSIDEDDIKAVEEVLRSNWLTTGPEIEKFEEAVCQFTGARYAVAIANGTAALHAAYHAAGIESGDEIITTGMTFAATANAALYLGAKPVFVDIDPSTGCLDPDKVVEKISDRTKAIVAVDYYGHPCEADPLNEIAAKANIRLIIDAAHSLGAEYNGKKVGTLASMTTFSFHPVKAITTGEGGMIVTDDADLYQRLCTFRTHGIVKSASSFEKPNEGPWYHEMQMLGFNYRITDFQAALGKQQLLKLPAFIHRRGEIAERYRRGLSELQHFKPLEEKENCRSAYHLFPIIVAKKPRAKYRRLAFEALHRENIGVQVHYIPVYQHPFYQKLLASEVIHCPQTDRFYDGEISLPIFPAMTDGDVDDVLKALRKIEDRILG
ncbi:MAG: UDP-4-amino-4,6-dideoxy-N-acetyl-beta-L-altrosamine transaminase [Cyanobacteria bacterium HKST-UBA01]|nr:UDP-4-amino-4,6-dideoxy-N-acetyl-beta-L-altrosamine transaminase [Cyanobacteria bacterium HKST-UBA01]